MRQSSLPVTLLCIALSALLSIWWARSITGSPIESDAGHTLKMALNLAHHGTASLGDEAPLVPSMYREPVPVFTTAAAVALTDMFLGQASHDDYFFGTRAQALKYQNLVWMLVLVSGIFVAVRMFTGSLMLGLLGIFAINFRLPATPSGLINLGLDTLESDLPAAAVLVWASFFLTKSLAGSNRLQWALTGLTFGVLALIKAAFLYVYAGVLAGTLLLRLMAHPKSGEVWRIATTQSVALAISFAAVVLPWMARNHAQLGSFDIAERGGIVLLIRAEKDLMSAEEFHGAFYVWAPPKIQPLIGKLTGFSPNDLQRHGRLQRLNRSPDSDFHAEDLAAETTGKPETALTYYTKARAERVRMQRELSGKVPSPSVAADENLQKRATTIILEHPGRHLAMTAPFLWRGAFVAFPLFLVALTYSMLRRRFAIAAFVLPAFGMVLFYGLFSHFIPRYSVPVVGIIVVAALVLAKAAADAMHFRPYRMVSGNPTSRPSASGN